jgi:hypothetical protein
MRIRLSIRIRLNEDAVNCHLNSKYRLGMNVRPRGICDTMVLEVKADGSYRFDYWIDSWDWFFDSS